MRDAELHLLATGNFVTLELTDKDILPIAVHDCELGDIEATFGGFQKSDRRMKLFSKLTEYVHALKSADIRGSLIVDGSFVMGCVDEPDDIDVVLILAEDWDLTADLKPYQYNLVSKRDVKRKFPIEVYPVIAGTEPEKNWTDFFHKINVKWYEPFSFETGAQKGVVRIQL